MARGGSERRVRGRAFIGQVIAVVQDEERRAFVSFDDLERWASEDAPKLPEVLRTLRAMYDSGEPRPGGIYVNLTTVERDRGSSASGPTAP